MSQKQFYSIENKDIYQLITTELAVGASVLFSKDVAQCAISSLPLAGMQLCEPSVESDIAVQHFAILGSDFTSDFISQLVANTDIDTWQLGALTKHLDVSRVDVSYSVHLTSAQLKSLQQLCITHKLDVIELTAKPTLLKPGLVVLDMDSTSITIECIDEIAKLADVGKQVAEITELAMQGKLDFSQSLRSRVSKLKGIEVSLLDTIANDLPLMPGMKELAQAFKSHGWRVAIASGGFTYFADNLKALLGLDAAVSNTLVIEDGKLTGEVAGTIVDAQVKADTVEALAKEYDIEMSQTIAIGDGANDLVMMEKAALGIAYHAKPLVQEQADVAINSGDLRSVIALLSR